MAADPWPVRAFLALSSSMVDRPAAADAETFVQLGSTRMNAPVP